MKAKDLTDAELVVLGLVAEMPRHGYQLEQVIEQRGMREWTRIGFSSIYFVLGKLEKMGLVSAQKPVEPKAKKVFSVTGAGRAELVSQSLAALGDLRPSHSSVLLGMAHWPMLERETALAALRARGKAIGAELARLQSIRDDQRPLPDFVEALFDHSLGQLNAEAQWIGRTLDRMDRGPGPERDNTRGSPQ